MGRRTLLLITSVLLAAVGTAIVAVYVRGADDRASQNQVLGTYVYALEAIDEGTTIQPEDVGVRELRSSDQLNSAATSVDDVVGRQAKSQILQFTTIDERTLTEPGADIEVEAPILAHEQGVDVQLVDQNRAVSLLGVGSWVRIFTLQNDKAVELVPKARVISVGDVAQTSAAPGPDGKNPVAATTVPTAVVGLSVEPKVALDIADAQMKQLPMYFAVLPDNASGTQE